MLLRHPISFLVCLFLLTWGWSTASQTATAQDVRAEARQLIESMQDRSVEPYQRALLDLAMDAAGAIPIQPHIKSRSRQQEQVISAGLHLGQFRWALEHKDTIVDWRRGAVSADIALALVKVGSSLEEVEPLLKLAHEIGHAVGLEEWRAGVVKTKVGQVYAWLGNHQKAAEYQTGIGAHETGLVAITRASRCDESSYPVVLAELDILASDQRFEIVHNGLKGYVALVGRFYDQIEKRQTLENKIRSSWSVVPHYLRLLLLQDLARHAIAHQDEGQALIWLNQAQEMVDQAQWPLDLGMILQSQMGWLRYQNGEKERGRQQVDEAWSSFDSICSSIVNIDRAKTLIPLAEAYQGIGETGHALAVYRRALEESQDNPNSRPRAEDLSAIVSSMAVQGVEPDEPMWARLRQIRANLSDPW